VNEARDRFEDFTGMAAKTAERIRVKVPRVVLGIGELDGVLYTTVRDGETEKYVHKFRKRSRPTLAVSSDGRSLQIIDGQYEFTERGIIDR
jgi:hypothetical protein